jgi:hypothetical protein
MAASHSNNGCVSGSVFRMRAHVLTTNAHKRHKKEGSRKNCCTLWNSQGARLMSLFSTITSLRKTTLRRDIIVDNKDITLAPWLFNTRQDRQKTRQETKDKATD